MVDSTNKHPLEDFEILSTEYVRLLNEKQVLLDWSKPQLEAMYTASIGIFQVERLQLQLQIKALKLKIEIVQGAINRQEFIDINHVEIAVAAELAEVESRILKEVNKIDHAKILLMSLGTPERSLELRKLYRTLAKQLHPDLVSQPSLLQSELWHLVLDAYNAGDVEQLKAVQLIYHKELTEAQEKLQDLTYDELHARSEILKDAIKKIQAEINTVRKDFPFNIQHQIQDKKWVEAELLRINAELKDLREYEIDLTADYKNLISCL